VFENYPTVHKKEIQKLISDRNDTNDVSSNNRKLNSINISVKESNSKEQRIQQNIKENE